MIKKIKKIIDISQPIYPGMAVYPGNPKVSIKQKKSKTSYFSVIKFGSHTGTHLDSERHIKKRGWGVDKIDWNKLIGWCRVLDLTSVAESVSDNDLKSFRIQKGERVLIKTRNSKRGFGSFYSDYIYLTSSGAKFLSQRGVLMAGIDSWSVKQKGSLDNRPHTYLLKNNIVIFEGLDLSKVDEGRYFFIGLPLKLKGLDGSPARAILIA